MHVNISIIFFIEKLAFIIVLTRIQKLRLTK